MSFESSSEKLTYNQQELGLFSLNSTANSNIGASSDRPIPF